MAPRDSLLVTIGTRKYPVDLAKFARRPAPSLREQIDQGAEAGEGSLANYGVWPRSGSNFIEGAGQDFFDDPDSSRKRFSTSSGIDPWTKRELKLLNSTRQIAASSQGDQYVLAVGGRVFHSFGATLRSTTDPTVANPVWTTITVSASYSITSLATDGTRIFIGTSNGIYVLPSTGATTANLLGAAGEYVAVVAYANGRLLMGTLFGGLYEVSATGLLTGLYAHPVNGFQWSVIVSAPNGIYAAGNGGGNGEIYFIGMDNVTTALTPPVWATAMPEGEQVYSLAHYVGRMIIGTSRGIRVANISATGFLSYGPVIETAYAGRGVYALEPQGDYVWFGWKTGQFSTGLGRLALSTATDPEGLVPAYATDLMTTSSGTATLSIASLNNRRYFTIAGVGLYAETTTKVESGFYDAGWVTYGIPENKSFSLVEVQSAPLAAGQSVELALVDPALDSTIVATHATLAATSTRTSVAGYDHDRVRSTLTLYRGTDTTTGPTVHRWTIRAMPMPFPADEIYLTLPIMDRVEDDRGLNNIPLDTLDEWTYLQGLKTNRTRVAYAMGGNTATVTVEEIGFNPGDVNAWNRDKTWLNGFITVKLLTAETG